MYWPDSTATAASATDVSATAASTAAAVLYISTLIIWNLVVIVIYIPKSFERDIVVGNAAAIPISG